MKLLFFLLPLFGSALGRALESPPDSCVATCPPPNCPGDNALDACVCLNQREYDCKARCPEYEPRILHCPRLPAPTSTTVSAPEPTPTECVCEEVFCILSFPEGCYCQNDAKKACFEKCGGEEPTYQDCTIPIDSVKARAPEPEPVPEPVPAPVPAPQDETCVCEDVICILSFPEGCYCRNDAKKACFEKCGGEEPTYDDCTVDIISPQPAPTPTPVPLPEPICVCEDVVCIQSIPESCLCRNAADKACFEKCGGEEPIYQDCGVDLTPRAAEPVPEPVPEPQDQVCIWCPEADCTLAFPEGCYCRNDNARKCFEECGGPEPIYEDCSIDIAPRAPEPVPEPVPEAQSETCTCEPVLCLGPESCRCAYDAAVACAQKCGGPAPPDFCPPRPVEAREAKPEPVPEAKPEPVPEAKPEPEAEVCTCEPVFCIQSWPQSCWCAYDAAAACAEKCGNPVPVDTCPPRPIEARKAEPEPVPEPVAEPQEETCECEPVVCIAQWPQSCWCFYNAEVRCAAKCGKPAPPPSTCPPIPVEARVAEPEPAPAPIPPPPPPPECECPLVNCISTQPELCECLNASAQRCYELCGGEKPVPQVCLPDASTTFSTSIIPLPTPVNPRQATPTNQICGGGRASPLQECPAGQTCITDPFTPGSCGPACDMLGICVSEKLCGGFAGFECDIPGQICVDDPRDDCDPLNGGSDCGGLCAWPQ